METTLIPHLLRKDLRHVRVLLGVWLFLLVTQATVISIGFQTGHNQFIWQIVYTLMAFGLPLMQGLVAMVLVTLLIQDEPLVGTTAFWFTRPISRGTLLAGKVTFVTCFLILPPLIVEAVMFAINGVEPRDILLMMPEILFTSLAIIVFSGALATITKNFGQFIIWLVIVWIAMMVTNGVVQFSRMMADGTYFTNPANLTLLYSQSLAAGVVQVVGGIVIILNQYLTRKRKVSIGLLVAVLIAQSAVQLFWRHDFFKKTVVAANQEVFSSESTKVFLKPDSITSSDAINFGRSSAPETSISGRLILQDVPAGYQLDLTNIQSIMTFPDGSTLKSSPILVLPALSRNTWWAKPLSDVLDQAHIVNGDEANSLYNQIFQLPTEEYQKRKGTDGTLKMSLEMEARKLLVIGRIPLQAGAKIEEGSRRIEIGQILHQADGCRILMHEQKLNFWWDRMPATQFSPWGDDTGIYLLFNREMNQAVLPDQSYQFDMASTLLKATSRLINRSFFIQFTGEKHGRQAFPIDAKWLEGAQLVRIEGEVAGSLKRTVIIPDFRLSAKK